MRQRGTDALQLDPSTDLQLNSLPTTDNRCVIDPHCHVLHGIDDGPDTLEGSLAIARAAAAGSTGTLVATTHVSRSYPNNSATIGDSPPS